MTKKSNATEETIPVEETAETLAALAEAIIRIDKGMKLILNAGMNRKAILLLVSSASGGMSQNQVARVIDGLDSLKEKFLTK